MAKKSEGSSGKVREGADLKKSHGVEYYSQLEYPVELVRDEDAYVASNPDLPGCISFGESPNEAIENLREVRSLWIQGQLESGNSIPEPSTPERFSGKFVLRIPKMLHRMADSQARREGVSLNTYITTVLASALTYSVQPRLTVSWDSEQMKQWWRTIHGWETRRVGASCEVHGITSEYGLFVNLISERVGNSSVRKLEAPERGEHYHA
jgi:predicted RNase H-like HicB family nuclease